MSDGIRYTWTDGDIEYRATDAMVSWRHRTTTWSKCFRDDDGHSSLVSRCLALEAELKAKSREETVDKIKEALSGLSEIILAMCREMESEKGYYPPQLPTIADRLASLGDAQS